MPRVNTLGLSQYIEKGENPTVIRNLASDISDAKDHQDVKANLTILQQLSSHHNNQFRLSFLRDAVLAPVLGVMVSLVSHVNDCVKHGRGLYDLNNGEIVFFVGIATSAAVVARFRHYLDWYKRLSELDALVKQAKVHSSEVSGRWDRICREQHPMHHFLEYLKIGDIKLLQKARALAQNFLYPDEREKLACDLDKARRDFFAMSSAPLNGAALGAMVGVAAVKMGFNISPPQAVGFGFFGGGLAGSLVRHYQNHGKDESERYIKATEFCRFLQNSVSWNTPKNVMLFCYSKWEKPVKVKKEKESEMPALEPMSPRPRVTPA